MAHPRAPPPRSLYCTDRHSVFNTSLTLRRSLTAVRGLRQPAPTAARAYREYLLPFLDEYVDGLDGRLDAMEAHELPIGFADL